MYYSRIVNSNSSVNGVSASIKSIEPQAMNEINSNQKVDFLTIPLNAIRSFLPGVFESDTFTKQRRKV